MDTIKISVTINKYKNVLSNVALILIALFVGFKVHNGEEAKYAVLSKVKEDELRKNDALKAISDTQMNVKAYQSAINKKDMSNIVGSIGKIARDSSVRITSIRPDNEVDLRLYTKFNYELSCATSGFHNIGKFLEALENAPELFSIENMSISPKQVDERKVVGFDLKISTILIPEGQK